MTNDTPSDEAISAMVDIAQTSGMQLSAGQRAELDGLIAHGLIERVAPSGPKQPVEYALTARGQKLLDDRGVGANES